MFDAGAGGVAARARVQPVTRATASAPRTSSWRLVEEPLCGAPARAVYKRGLLVTALTWKRLNTIDGGQ